MREWNRQRYRSRGCVVVLPTAAARVRVRWYGIIYKIKRKNFSIATFYLAGCAGFNSLRRTQSVHTVRAVFRVAAKRREIFQPVTDVMTEAMLDAMVE